MANSNLNGKVDLSKLKLDENFITNFLEKFDGVLRNKLSAFAKLLKTLKGLEKINQADFDEIKEEKESESSDKFKKSHNQSK
ncbi:hypothetical protein HYD59_02715 [Mycoplasmopsis bovis]|nr:hypothetical protein [Mycoplasmopsis bovis]QQH61026.1 hypothetical protein HYD59_02715 [Mycoplasmopsis bovis]